MISPAFVSLAFLVITLQYFDRTSLAEPGDVSEDARPLPLGPISFISMQFLAKILLNNRFSPQTHGMTPPSGKSWIHHDTSIQRAFGIQILKTWHTRSTLPTVTSSVFEMSTQLPQTHMLIKLFQINALQMLA